eukprot:scaffold50714_cov22-Tisochrysis_lutea.AAC.1
MVALRDVQEGTGADQIAINWIVIRMTLQSILFLSEQVLTAGKISRELNSLAAAGHGSSCVAIVGTRVAIQLPCN